MGTLFNSHSLVVRDLEKSRWFYGTVLGMKEVSRPKTFKFGGACFASGACEVHLLLAKDTKVSPTPYSLLPKWETYLILVPKRKKGF